MMKFFFGEQRRLGDIMKIYLIVVMLCAGVLVMAGYKAWQWVDDRQAQEETSALDLTADWTPAAQFAARLMISRYGPPQEMSPIEFNWHNHWPWKSITVRNDPKAPLKESVVYEVPPDKLSALQRFQHGPLVFPKNSELVASSDREMLNRLSLNLAHDIATGKRTPQEADRFFIRTVRLSESGKSSPYLERLLFPVPAQTPHTYPYL